MSLRGLFDRAKIAIHDDGGIPDVEITAVVDDSRRVGPGACFVAIRGTKENGNWFLEAAVAAGASAIVMERRPVARLPVPFVIVREAREALAKLSAAFHDLDASSAKPLPAIGITGTNGKTTVAWLLRAILREAGFRPAMIGTVEYDLVSELRSAEMTTPGAVELCRHLCTAREAGAAHAVMEVSSHALDQRRCDGLNFAAGVFTNLTGDHLDYHGTMEAYGAAKQRLFELLAPQAAAVVNIEDPFGRVMASQTAGRIFTYGLDRADAVVTARVDALDSRGSRFVLQAPGIEVPVKCNLIGRHNVLNVLAAAATALALRIPIEAIRGGIALVHGVPGRLQRAEPDGHPFSVLVDYAHTDDALRNVLQAIRPLTSGRVICVFGCGGDRDRYKRPRMAAVAAELADVAIVTSDNPRSEEPRAIIEDILVGFGATPACRVEVEVDRRAAIEAAIGAARPGDTVLIAGKGHEPYQLIGERVLPFDDLVVARECLRGKRAADFSPRGPRRLKLVAASK